MSLYEPIIKKKTFRCSCFKYEPQFNYKDLKWEATPSFVPPFSHNLSPGVEIWHMLHPPPPPTFTMCFMLSHTDCNTTPIYSSPWKVNLYAYIVKRPPQSCEVDKMFGHDQRFEENVATTCESVPEYYSTTRIQVRTTITRLFRRTSIMPNQKSSFRKAQCVSTLKPLTRFYF